MQKTSVGMHFESERKFKNYLKSMSSIDFESTKAIVENYDFVKDSLFVDLSKKLSDDLTVEQFIYWIDLRKSKKINDVISIGLQKLKNDLTFDEIENLIKTIESSKHAKKLIDISENLGKKNSDLTKAAQSYFSEKKDSKKQEFAKKISEAIAAEKKYLNELQSVLEKISEVLNCENLFTKIDEIDEIDEIINEENLSQRKLNNLISKINDLNKLIGNSQIVSLSKRNPDFQFKYDDLVNVIKKMKKTESFDEKVYIFFLIIAFNYNIPMDYNLFILLISKFSDFDFRIPVNFYFETFSNEFKKISDKDSFLNKVPDAYFLLTKKIAISDVINYFKDGMKIADIACNFLKIKEDNIGKLEREKNKLETEKKELEKNTKDAKVAKAIEKKEKDIEKKEKEIEKAIKEKEKAIVQKEIDIKKAIEKKGELVNELVQGIMEYYPVISKRFFKQHQNFKKYDIKIIDKTIIAALKVFVGGTDKLYDENFEKLLEFFYKNPEFFNEFLRRLGEIAELAFKLSEEDYKKDDIEGKAKEANELAQKALKLMSDILKKFLAKNKKLDESNKNMLNKMIIIVLKKFIGGTDKLYNEFNFVDIFSFLYDDSKFFNVFKGKAGEVAGLAFKLSEEDYKKDDIEGKAKEANELAQKAIELMSDILKNFLVKNKKLDESNRNMLNEMIIIVLKKFIGGTDDSYNGFDFVDIFSFLYDDSKFFNVFKGKAGEVSALTFKLSEEDYKKDDIEGKAKEANELAQKAIELMSDILKNFLVKNKKLDESNRNMLNEMIIIVLKKFIGGTDDSYNGFDFVDIFSFLYDGSKFFNVFKGKVGELSALKFKLLEEDYEEDIEAKIKDEKEFSQKIFELSVNVLDIFLAQNKNSNESKEILLNKCDNLLKGFLFRSNLEIKFGAHYYEIIENCVSLKSFTPFLKKIKEIDLKLPPSLMFMLVYMVDNVENDDDFKNYFKENYVTGFDFTNGIELYQLLCLFKYPQLLDYGYKILDNFLSSDINLCFLKGNNKKDDDFSGVVSVSDIKKDDEHYYCVGFFCKDKFIYVSEDSLEFSDVQPLLEKIISNIEQLNFWLPFLYFAIKNSIALMIFLSEKGIDIISCLNLYGEQSKSEFVFNNFCMQFQQKRSMKTQEERKRKEEEERKKKEEEERKKKEEEERKKKEEEERKRKEEEERKRKEEEERKRKEEEERKKKEEEERKRKEKEEQKKKEEEQTEREKQDKLFFKDIKQNVNIPRSKSHEFKSKELISEYESNIKENKEEEENKVEKKEEEQENKNQDEEGNKAEEKEEEQEKKEENKEEKEKEEQKNKKEEENKENKNQEEQNEQGNKKQYKLLFKDIEQNANIPRSKSQEFKSKKLISEYESNIKENNEKEEQEKKEEKEPENKNQEEPENKKTNSEKDNQKEKMILFGGLALFFLVLTLTISILTFGTGIIPMFALSTLIYNSIFGALTAGLGVGFFTFAVLFFKNFGPYFKNKRSLEVLSKSENSLPDNIESESGKSVPKKKMSLSKSLSNLSDTSNQTNEEKPKTVGENSKKR